jgi:diacylglycerol kinase family enzyme
MKTYHLKIEHDGGVLEGDYVFGAVTNSTSVAGLLKLSDNDVKMDDGLFEVLLILAPKSSVEFNKIIKGLLKQKYDVEYVTFFHTSKIKITCESDVSWCLDGEDGGLCKEAVIMNNQKAVTLLR